ncbi:MAG TPA: PAS domain S-box protein [Candidatus Eisenbacteria bacterium]|nr:PAS domain S-box protein [Candidatus Eisenbacteria bacterium]
MAFEAFPSPEDPTEVRVARPPVWARYGTAIAAVLLAWFARQALSHVIGPTALPFIFFFPAVAVAGWWGGFVPGLLAIVLSSVLANWSFMRPIWALSLSTFDVAAALSFAFSAAFILAAIEAMHRARARLDSVVEERRRAQGEIARALELSDMTLASIGDGVIVTDADGRIVTINREAERLTEWTGSEAVGRPVEEVFRILRERDRKPAENPVARTLREGRIVNLANHTLLVSRTGREIPIEDSAAPIRRGEGPVQGAVLVFRDAMLQRKAHETSVRLAAIVESSGDAILTKTLDGTIRTWNRGAERLFGYKAEEIIGRSITTLIPPERLHEEPEIIERLKTGQPYERLETVRLAKGGRRIIVSLSVSPLRDADGEVVGASKIVHDVTDVVAAREALAREKELLATTLSSIGDGVIVTDAQGCVTFLNPEAERLTGWTQDDAQGRPLPAVFRIVGEATRRTVKNPVDEVLRRNAVVGLANHTILIARDGSERAIDDSAAPIRVNGALSGVVLVFRDVTERRRADAILREEDRRKDEFLAILSHELRNPIAPIGMAVDLMRKKGPADPEIRELRDIIERQTNQLARLLDDLLDVSRIVSGKIVLRPEQVSLGVAISSAVEAVRPAVRTRGHQLTVELPPEPVYVEGDLARLAQVFTNLLHNSVKYTDPGGSISINLVREGSDALVRVRDNGIGLTVDQMSRIFQMFAQGTRLTDGTQQGLGVGLALSRKLVELHGGQIEVKSGGAGRGSEFLVRLPVTVRVQPETPADLAAAGPSVASPGLRILIADDNADSVTTLCWSLEHSGHEVRTASDGIAAVEVAREFRPQLALLDIGMPRLNGYDAAREIRKVLGDEVTLVAVTGWGQEEDKRRAREAGFDRHVTKPIDIGTLDRMVAEVS